MYLFLLFHFPYPPSLLTSRDTTQVRGNWRVDREKSISGKKGLEVGRSMLERKRLQVLGLKGAKET